MAAGVIFFYLLNGISVKLEGVLGIVDPNRITDNNNRSDWPLLPNLINCDKSREDLLTN